MSRGKAVPKPSKAGSGVYAVAQTKSALSNLRSGPGVEYDDIGDITDNSLVVYYPETRRDNDWLWLEMGALQGWIYAGYVTFVAALGTSPRPPRSTPYDGKQSLWFWKGSAVQERSVEALLKRLKLRAPHVQQIWVKISDGEHWMARYDDSPLAIRGPESIERWIAACAVADIEFHAWAVPHGLDIARETAPIIAACRLEGLRSLILDVEPYTNYWQGGASAVRPFMLTLRRSLGTRFHIGMSVDPRPQHYRSVFPGEWQPFIDSLHPQSYWKTFRKSPEECLQSVWRVWGGLRLPIIPALQGDAAASEQSDAHTVATKVQGAPGLSWWRYGIVSQWAGMNRPIELKSAPETSSKVEQNIADEIIIFPQEEGFRSGSDGGAGEPRKRRNSWGWDYFYARCQLRSRRHWARWQARLPQSGLYEIAVFVPNRYATTRRARYRITGIYGTDADVVVDINQFIKRNSWEALGVFDLDRNKPQAGVVQLDDVTGESGKFIAFDAVRYRRIANVPAGYEPPPSPKKPSIIKGVPVADGFDAPVGTSAQRRGRKVWPPGWLDASPFGKLYFSGTPNEAYHTGADLNYGRPYEDRGMPCFSCASGVVIFAARMGVWGNLLIIRHDPLYKPGGQVIYSRYGHVQSMQVKVGQRVKRGQKVCEVGDAFGRFVPHLHFDLSPTTLFETRPTNWPRLNYNLLMAHYIDPLDWIRRHRP